MNELNLQNKLSALQELLQTYSQVITALGRDTLMPPKTLALAFSGGVDSTLLLRVACDTIGAENVTALHAVSCLIPEQDQIKAKKTVSALNGLNCSYQTVQVEPLDWPEFIVNSEQRCYFCKKRIYGAIQQVMSQNPSPFSLMDGTNTDDLLEHRPGLVAIQELCVLTPLAEAKFNKQDIRTLAEKLGLKNYNQPSNSCLATRIPVHQPITRSQLTRIAKAEQFLHNKGFLGCRVKMGTSTVEVQVLQSDLHRFMTECSCSDINKYFKNIGFNKVFVDPKGRVSL
ncbi:MAG TPA: ATP-dependent sacrificial sulfur transferase LarE [Acinetobacter lwoffii]|nr:ATP-dependent sacrificial sulfur transferase LarE [Acinetobacter lwoffii]